MREDKLRRTIYHLFKGCNVSLQESFSVQTLCYLCQVGVLKGKTMEGEVDPNAVTQEGKDQGEQKASFYLKADYQSQRQTKRGQEAK